MSNWSKQEIDNEAKSLTNAKLLDETLEAVCGDDYDGCFTPRGQYRAEVLTVELKRRLEAWLSANGADEARR